MFYIVFASILVLIVIVCFILAPVFARARANYSGSSYSRPLGPAPFIIGGTVAVVALLGFTLLCSAASVEARSVAVQTSFGKYVTTLDGGLHWIAPWDDTEQFDTTIQPVDLADDANDKGGKVPVAFKGGGGGWVNATARWSVTKESVQGLWEKYRSFDKASNDLVNRATRDAIINSANDFTALEARSDQAALNAKVIQVLGPVLKDYGINLDSVSILSVPLDDKTQGSLDAIVVANNNVEKAKADKARAEIDAQTAQLRASTNSVTPELNQRYCLDIVNVWDVAKNGPLPATFDCGLGTKSEPLVTVPAR